MATSETERIRRLTQRLDRLTLRLKNPEQANREASIQLYGFVIKNFQQEGGLVGGWAPLAPATVKQKAKIGKELILVRTGQLKASFVPFHDVANAGVGTNLPYAVDHEKGVKSRNLPARHMLPPQKVATEIGIKVYNAFIKRELQEASGRA